MHGEDDAITHREEGAATRVDETMRVTVRVNGTEYTREVEPRQLLVYFLREQCGLPGTRVGCDTTSCGACTVLLEGRRVKSCTVLAVQADGFDVDTVEGLADAGILHPIQEEFHNHHGLQCGYCTPGFLMSAVGLIDEVPGLTEDGIREGLEGNLCRCTGYENIVKAVGAAAKRMGANIDREGPA